MTARAIEKVWTVGELRALGFDQIGRFYCPSEEIPDCAEVPGTLDCDQEGPPPGFVWTFTPSGRLRWVTITGKVSV